MEMYIFLGIETIEYGFAMCHSNTMNRMNIMHITGFYFESFSYKKSFIYQICMTNKV